MAPFSTPYFMPKSLRLTVKMASKPADVPLPMLAMPVNSTAATIDLVTPCMVRSPVTSKVFSPVFLAPVLLKVIVGKSFAPKKSGLRRCLFRPSTPVSTDSVLMVMSNFIPSALPDSKVKLPETSLKRPQNCPAPMWWTRKRASEWVSSTVQTVSAGAAVAAWSAAAPSICGARTATADRKATEEMRRAKVLIMEQPCSSIRRRTGDYGRARSDEFSYWTVLD